MDVHFLREDNEVVAGFGAEEGDGEVRRAACHRGRGRCAHRVGSADDERLVLWSFIEDGCGGSDVVAGGGLPGHSIGDGGRCRALLAGVAANPEAREVDKFAAQRADDDELRTIPDNRVLDPDAGDVVALFEVVMDDDDGLAMGDAGHVGGHPPGPEAGFEG